MRIIDRYLLRQFATNFIITFVSLTGLYVVIDAFANLDNFVEYANGNGGLLRVIVEHYAYRSVAFFNKTSGILSLIAAVFTITWFQRYNEMTALMAAGVSRWRVLVPILVAVLVVSGLTAVNREVVLPQIRDELAREPRDLNSEQASTLASRYDSETDILLDGQEIQPAEFSIRNPSFVMPASLAEYGRKYAAASAEYLPATDERPSGYLLKGVTSPIEIENKRSLHLGERQVVYMPADTAGLKTDEIFVASRVPLELLNSGSNWRDFASTGELITELQNPSVDFGNDVRVSLHRRFLQPFMDTTLLMLGLPLVVSRSNRNPFIAIGLCVAVCAAFFVVTLGCQSLGVSGWLKPSLAMWIPLMLFVPIATLMTGALRR